MVIFYKKWKNYNEIQLKNKMDLNNRKMANHLPSPAAVFKIRFKFEGIYIYHNMVSFVFYGVQGAYMHTSIYICIIIYKYS